MKWSKIFITGIATATIFSTVPITNLNVATAASIEQVLSGQKVKITNNATLTIRDAQILSQEQGKLLAFTVAINNTGTTSINLIDYWMRVKNKSGKNFKLKLAEMDKNKGTVVAGTTTYLTYFAYVDANTKLSDIIYDAVKWDFSVPSYERVLGTITTPANASGLTDVNKSSTILLNNSLVNGTVKSYTAVKDQINTTATIRFELQNTGNKAVDLSKLTFNIQTNDWSVYKADVSLSSNSSLGSKQTTSVLLNISLPNNVAAKTLSIVPAIIDEANKIELPLGAFALPSLSSTKPTAVNKTFVARINSENVETSIVSSELLDNDSRQEASIEFKMKNTSGKTTSFNNVEFFIETSNGTMYPLEFNKEEIAKLLPNLEYTVVLKGIVPNDLNLNASRLIMKQTDSEGARSYLLGLYALSNDGISVGNDNIYRTKDYQVDLLSINRIPDEVDDVLVTQLSITNNSNKAIKLPALSGYYLADGVKVETTTNEIALDNSINIAPKASYQLVVYTKVPYTAEIHDVAFVLTQKNGETAKNLYQYKAQLPESVGQSIKSPYVIDNIGKRASIHVKNATINKSSNKNYFYGEFDLVNKEIRTSNVSQLGGYLEDSQGILVPITFTGIEDKVLPNGKVLYAAYGLLPESFDQKKYKLYIGQAIAIGSVEQKEKLLVNPVAYAMKTQTQELNTNLQNIQFGGHVLNITEASANVRIKDDFIYEGIDLNLKYDLNKDDTYQTLPKDQKIIIELVDQGPAKATYSKEFTLADGENQIDLGNQIRLPIYYADEKLMTKISSFQKYTLNIFTAYNDQKMLVASREIQWFYSDSPGKDAVQ
ncbi:hypothetical protein B1748_18700 [Paenibacillus sp. MY03]|jgi:hypothetical protein|uniref:hypothetical protein n=1 Tax=Paenibacillus sp. MY03 TaxID=302980 RepID=UPI000B3BE29F|nr:hypothetical protein [Paenibacillus sp. MY03]OUS75166.1 hypothetical protein B1748_18700 [Paenibacillus sp. MY03]